jgi:hypothetical protein
MKQVSIKLMLLGAIAVSTVAFAEMSSVRLEATVKSFDEKFVTIQLNKRTVRVPRSVVGNKTLKAGSIVQITFRGDEIDYLFPTDGGSERSPASADGK